MLGDRVLQGKDGDRRNHECNAVKKVASLAVRVRGQMIAQGAAPPGGRQAERPPAGAIYALIGPDWPLCGLNPGIVDSGITDASGKTYAFAAWLPWRIRAGGY
jgi:hypothetical protein